MEKHNFKEIFGDIEGSYRPVPFWSWNEKLDARQASSRNRACGMRMRSSNGILIIVLLKQEYKYIA